MTVVVKHGAHLPCLRARDQSKTLALKHVMSRTPHCPFCSRAEVPCVDEGPSYLTRRGRDAGRCCGTSRRSSLAHAAARTPTCRSSTASWPTLRETGPRRTCAATRVAPRWRPSARATWTRYAYPPTTRRFLREVLGSAGAQAPAGWECRAQPGAPPAAARDSPTYLLPPTRVQSRLGSRTRTQSVSRRCLARLLGGEGGLTRQSGRRVPRCATCSRTSCATGHTRAPPSASSRTRPSSRCAPLHLSAPLRGGRRSYPTLYPSLNGTVRAGAGEVGARHGGRSAAVRAGAGRRSRAASSGDRVARILLAGGSS